MKLTRLRLPLKLIAWVIYAILALGIVFGIIGLIRLNGPIFFIQAVLDGLKLGFVYALIALGYTMVSVSYTHLTLPTIYSV